MNSNLIKLLLQPIFIPNSSNKNNEDKSAEYYEDDFSSLKRINRLFTNKQKEQCWNKAQKIPHRHPDRWRYDAVGNPVLKALKGCHGPLCHEYDHIIPFSKGGETVIRNCQILQTSVNKFKSNKTDLNKEKLQNNSHKLKLSNYEMDLIEEVIYGNVKKIEI